MAARGNRWCGVGRFGVAFLATVAVVLGSTQTAHAQEATPAPPPPADTASSDPSAADTSTPPSGTADAEPAPQEPAAEPDPAPQEPAAEPDPAPAPDAAAPDAAESEAASSPDSTPAPDVTPAEEPAAAPENVVKLEPQAAPATQSAPTAPAAAPAPQAAPVPASSAPPSTTIVLIHDSPAVDPASEPETPVTEATKAEAIAAGTAPIVSFRPQPEPSAVAFLPSDEPTATVTSSDLPVAIPSKSLLQQSCARPSARVPLSQRCKQARAVAAMRVTLTNMSSPAEVRAAIARVVVPVTARRVEARPQPDSKAAEKHPVAEVRPIIPFGDSGQGAINEGFSGSSGSTWSSRLFALAPVPVRAQLPRRFARLLLPSTIPHGVIAAPPTARPG